MLQQRAPDGRAYALGRDIAQLFPRIAQQACKFLGMGGWHPQIKGWAEHAGLTQQDLVRAEVALAKFVLISTTDKATSKHDAWVNSGLSDLHPAAQIMIFYFVGTVTLDTYLQGVREATRAGQTAHGAERLLDRVERLAHAQQAGLPSAKIERFLAAEEAAEKMQSDNAFDN